MDFKVIFKDTFVADLEQIVRRIALHNLGAAKRLGEIIIQMAESLIFSGALSQAPSAPGHQEIHRAQVFQGILPGAA